MLAMFALIALHVPIGVAMAIIGGVGTALIIGIGPSLSLFAVEPVSALSSLDLATIPLFILMGSLAAASGISADLYRIASSFLGHRPGGLSMATVAGCAGFGAICGSSVATTASMAKIALPEMEKRGYSSSLAVGSIAGGGSLGILIPPSIMMVIYAVLTEQFVLDLFLAGIIPGLISVFLYFCAIAIVARRSPEAAPAGPRAAWTERMAAIAGAWRALTVIFIVTVGIYSGIFTVTEAAAVGVFTTAVFWALSADASLPSLGRIFRETAATTGMIFLMVVGAHILSYFVTLTDAPNVIVRAISEAGLPPLGIIFGILLVYLVLGAIFDAVAAMVLTIPFVFPLVVSLGYDPIWWGIINVMIIEIALITPPIGINVFVMHAAAPHVKLLAIYRGIVPFLAADIVRISLIILFPALATFLPNVLG